MNGFNTFDTKGLTLLDTRLVKWLVSYNKTNYPLISAVIDLKQIPVSSPLAWVEQEGLKYDFWSLSLDLVKLKENLALPESQYAPFSYYDADDVDFSLPYLQKVDFPYNLTLEKGGHIDFHSTVAVAGFGSGLKKVTIRTLLDGNIVDESSLEIPANDTNQRLVATFWAGELEVGDHEISVEVLHDATEAAAGQLIKLSKLRTKYFGSKKI